jgi:hypothetical protein
MKKVLKVAVFIIAAFAAIWFSFYTEPLKEHQEKELIKQFSPNQLVDYHWKNDLDALLKTALDYKYFNSGMCQDAEDFSNKHAKIPGIGSKSFFLICGEVTIKEVTDEALCFELCPQTTARILTKFIFTNTVRDVSGWFNAGDFQNTMDFNTLSTYLNKKILAEVVGPVKQTLSAGDKLAFWGAVEIAPEDYPVKVIDVVPLRLQTKTK